MADVLRQRMEAKSSEELCGILADDDPDNWTDEALDVAERVLVDRGEPVPPRRRGPMVYVAAPTGGDRLSLTFGLMAFLIIAVKVYRWLESLW